VLPEEAAHRRAAIDQELEVGSWEWLTAHSEVSKQEILDWTTVELTLRGTQKLIVRGDVLFATIGNCDYAIDSLVAKSLVYWLERGKTLKYPRSKNGVPIFYVQVH
jgi:hypothetical protein